MTGAYYNEFDPKAAAWLRELIKAGRIAPGEVDERSITDVEGSDLNGFTQCHFFAGIGVWSYALRCAGWPDDRPVWTGSCPCQPFSAAGRRLGNEDSRHLWPVFYELVAQQGPPVIFGEQVASKAGRDWFSSVRLDLEGVGYGVGGADLCAAGVGAPHIRQRIYFVAERMANPSHDGLQGRVYRGADKERGTLNGPAGRNNPAGGMADAMPAGWPTWRTVAGSGSPASLCGNGGMAYTADDTRFRSESRPAIREFSESPWAMLTPEGRTGTADGLWRNPDWLRCRDGKWRPVESGTFPLAHGAAARVGRLRGYGNAIVAPLAQAFVEAYMYL